MNLSRTSWLNCCLIFFVFLTPALVSAEELTRGPYLQTGTEEGVTIRWRSDEPTDSKVEYGNAPGNLSQSAVTGESVTDHVVTLTGLDAGTIYFYNVGSTTQVLAGGDSKHSFKTHPGAVCGNDICQAGDGEDCVSCPDDCNGVQVGKPVGRFCCGGGGGDNPLTCSDSQCTEGASCTDEPIGGTESVRIWVIGDPGWNQTQPGGGGFSEKVYEGFQTANAGEHVDAWLMLGDNAYSDGTDEEYQISVFDVFTEHLPNTILWSTRGNHERTDYSGSVYFDIFSFPEAAESGGLASGSEAYFSFDYANIHFICLDSQGTSMTSDGAQASWLSADIADTNQDWIVAFWHHPPYSKGSHDSDDEGPLVAARENMNPILEAGGVDLVLNGHSHSYERSFLIDGHYGFSDSWDPSEHLVDGSSGQGENPYTKDQGSHLGAVYVVEGASSFVSHDNEFGHPVHYVAQATAGSVIIDTSGNTMNVNRIKIDGSTQDTFSIVKNLGGVDPKAHTPNPFDRDGVVEPHPGAWDVSVDHVLSWSAGDGAISHDVYFGTNGSEFQGNQTGTSFDPGTLAMETTYSWRVDEINADGTETGDVWSFTTEGPSASIEMAKTIYAPDEEVVVNYFDLPGSTQNWVGLFEAGPGTNPDDQTAYVSYRYTDGTEGSVSFSGRSSGEYEARLFFSDLFNLEDRVSFSVAECNENGLCEPGETCDSCSDCAGETKGKPSGRFCCGNGVEEPPETSLICDGNF